jgi:hypothetical protein
MIGDSTMANVSTFRLYLLRAGYLLIAVGLAVQIWPAILYRVSTMGLMHGTVTCMLFALSVLAVLGIRYPLQMLPLLFFELTWKAVWLLTVALPQWSTNRMDAATADSAIACLMGVIFPIIIPWPYVYENYVKKAGDPWRGRAAPRAPVPDLGNAPL